MSDIYILFFSALLAVFSIHVKYFAGRGSPFCFTEIVKRKEAYMGRSLAMGLLRLFTGLVEIFLGLRFVLKLFGASPTNGFVGWVYDMSGILLEPFRGIFSAKVLNNTYVFEFTTMFAMLVYALLALLIEALVDAVTPPVMINPDAEVVKRRRRWW